MEIMHRLWISAVRDAKHGLVVGLPSSTLTASIDGVWHHLAYQAARLWGARSVKDMIPPANKFGGHRYSS